MVVTGRGSVASAFGGLPGPARTGVLAMAGILASCGPLASIGGKMLTNGKMISSAFETAALKAMYLKDNTAALATGAGALGLVIAAGTIAWSNYNRTKAEAAAIEADYTRILTDQTGEVERNLAAHAGTEILSGAVGERLRGAGGQRS